MSMPYMTGYVRNNDITKPSKIRVIRVRNKAMVSTRAQAYIVSPVLGSWADGKSDYRHPPQHHDQYQFHFWAFDHTLGSRIVVSNRFAVGT